MGTLWRWGIKLWTLFGIEVRVHLVFVLWIAFDLIRLGVRDGLEFWAVTSVFLFGIVLLHEYGHCYAGRLVGGSAERILMWPLGGLAFVAAPYKPTPQLIVAVGGPLVNVAFLVLLTPAMLVSDHVLWYSNLIDLRFGVPPSDRFHLYLSVFYAINLDLLLFNLIPAFPMDGGRILRSLLWYRLGLERATALAVPIAKACAVCMGIAGLAALFAGVQGFLLLAMGVLVWFGAEQERRMVMGGYLQDEGQFFSGGGVPPARRTSWFARRRQRRQERRLEREARGRVERDQQVDALLDKVHREGISSLSPRERKFLTDASRHYKR